MSPGDTPLTPEGVTFATDIKPPFRDKDRTAMKRAFDLWSYDDVRALAEAIAGRLRRGTMPCDGAWPADRVALFDRWPAGGTLP